MTETPTFRKIRDRENPHLGNSLTEKPTFRKIRDRKHQIGITIAVAIGITIGVTIGSSEVGE